MDKSQAADKEKILARLRRVEGQVRGIHRMVDSDTYCVDVLNQIAAARAALDKVGSLIFENHTRGCVARAIKGNDHEDEAITELIDIFKRFVRG